jgi:hypothetical protein
MLVAAVNSEDYLRRQLGRDRGDHFHLEALWSLEEHAVSVGRVGMGVAVFVQQTDALLDQCLAQNGHVTMGLAVPKAQLLKFLEVGYHSLITAQFSLVQTIFFSSKWKLLDLLKHPTQFEGIRNGIFRGPRDWAGLRGRRRSRVPYSPLR